MVVTQDQPRGFAMPISQRRIDAFRADSAGSRRILWDDQLKGFGVIALPSGIASYIFDYRNSEGRKRRITIAKVGRISADQARTIAKGHAELVASGGDPLAKRQDRREADTVSDLLDAYLASPRFAEKAASTRAIDVGRVAHHLKPTLGRLVADQVTRDDCRRAFQAITSGKTAKTAPSGKRRGVVRARGGETAARSCLRLLSAVFNWAMEGSRVPANPVAGLDLGKDGERELILSESEYRALFAALNDLEAKKLIRSAAADAIRIIAMTGARKSEIACLTWNQVDLRAGRIVLPPTRHKTGRKTGKPRIIPLPAAAQAIIADQPSGPPDSFVFAPARGNGGEIELQRPWVEVRKAARLPQNFTLHGLRHSVASWLAMGGAQAAEVMQALGHRQLSTAARYVHFADQARATLAERAAAPALAGIAAAAGAEPAPVEPIRQGRK